MKLVSRNKNSFFVEYLKGNEYLYIFLSISQSLTVNND